MTDRESRYFSRHEMEAMGFRHVGREAQIARTSRLYEPKYISIGDYSIVDDFCILSGNIDLGRNVHVAHGQEEAIAEPGDA